MLDAEAACKQESAAMLTLFASVAYLVNSALCALAARVSHRSHRRHSSDSPRFWLLAGAFFLVLAGMRLTGVEDAIRDFLRSWLVADGEYGSRRVIQGAIVVALLCAAFGIALWARWVSGTREGGVPDRAIRWARRGVWAMTALIVLRLISFHPIDILLYRQLHLNWVIDIGSTVLVAACAIVSLRSAASNGRAASAVPRDRRRAAARPADPS